MIARWRWSWKGRKDDTDKEEVCMCEYVFIGKMGVGGGRRRRLEFKLQISLETRVNDSPQGGFSYSTRQNASFTLSGLFLWSAAVGRPLITPTPQRSIFLGREGGCWTFRRYIYIYVRWGWKDGLQILVIYLCIYIRTWCP